jgi:hypothetical protein
MEVYRKDYDHNVSSCAYTPDYGARITNDSYFSRRILVAGASIQW